MRNVGAGPVEKSSNCRALPCSQRATDQGEPQSPKVCRDLRVQFGVRLLAGGWMKAINYTTLAILVMGVLPILGCGGGGVCDFGDMSGCMPEEDETAVQLLCALPDA